MSLPTYDQFIEPLLVILAGHGDGMSAADAQELVSAKVGLTDAEKSELLPSGRQAVYKNRIGWAHDRLKRAGLSRSPKRGFWCLTPKGFQFAKQYKTGLPPAELDEIVHVPADSKVNADFEVPTLPSPSESTAANASPEERIDEAVRE